MRTLAEQRELYAERLSHDLKELVTEGACY